ncbi:uncharacterized protein AC631_02396 [Debaryomyces fabryi]|uniref:DNA replication regulator Sld3 C-terminal domain-containing protein n=1 Tax=Debaryomyces fabryi TaxID=58627 RepID=A0A0V1Q041_9ASCO|nr:uncharacterized protein AC631_02396 [Debaryomyces fabryi]KSA01863.1 hypothetical protein AC631_02396 [Debaryomyces fabryi]
MIQIPKDIKLKDIDSKVQGRVPISGYKKRDDCISRWRFDIELLNKMEAELTQVDNFTMKPPSTKVIAEDHPKMFDYSPQSQKDPVRFLYSRYYSILYSLNTPLSYFPKTTISRLKNLCGNDADVMKEHLSKLHLSVKELDDRHSGKYGILKTLDVNEIEIPDFDMKIKYENQNQKEFLIKNHDLFIKLRTTENNQNNVSDSNKNANQVEKVQFSENNNLSFVFDLKVREAQLQILILLELLDCWQVVESDFLATNLKRQEKEEKQKTKQKKKSLVRKKSITSKKIVPTFLGMGVDIQDKHISSQPESTEINEYIVYETLNTLLDRIGLWDTLLDRPTGDKDESSLGFLAYVLIPYFRQRLPLTIKYIIERVKGLNLKLNSKLNRQNTQKQSNSNEIKDIANEKATTNTHVNRTSKFAKVHIDPKQVPFLKKSSSTISLNYDLLPAFSLKRSKSTLSSKNLQKRQVDMSLNLKSFSESNRDNNEKQPTVSRSYLEKSESENRKQIIFGNAKKLKSQPDIRLNNKHEAFSQVEATPAKKKPEGVFAGISSEITTPTHPNRYQSNSIAKTPVGQFIRPTVAASYKETTIPCSTVKDRPSLSDRLISASLAPPVDVIVNSSPVNTHSALKINEPTPEVIASSPFNSIAPVVDLKSSPLQAEFSRKRKKPGEPISYPDSAFFDTTMNGSPVSTLLKEANTNDSTSIFKRSSTKRNKSTLPCLKQTTVNIINDSDIVSNIRKNDQEYTDDVDSDYERLMKPQPSSNYGINMQKAFKTYKRTKRIE